MMPIGFRFDKETKDMPKDRNRRDSVKVIGVKNGIVEFSIFTTDLVTGKTQQIQVTYVEASKARKKLRAIIRALR